MVDIEKLYIIVFNGMVRYNGIEAGSCFKLKFMEVDLMRKPVCWQKPLKKKTPHMPQGGGSHGSCQFHGIYILLTHNVATKIDG